MIKTSQKRNICPCKTKAHCHRSELLVFLTQQLKLAKKTTTLQILVFHFNKH